MVVEDQATSYYEIVRRSASEMQTRDNYGNQNPKPVKDYLPAARKEIWDRYKVIYRPVDRRDNYVKRCVGLPGDTITIISGDLYVNGKLVPDNNTQQTTYVVVTNGTTINPKAFERLSINKSDQRMISGAAYLLPLTKANAEDNFEIFKCDKRLLPIYARKGEYAPYIFPYSPLWDGMKTITDLSGFL